MEIFITICVILFILCIMRKGKRKQKLKYMIRDKLQQVENRFTTPVSQMTEEEKYYEAVIICQNLLEMLSDNTLAEKVNTYFKTGNISEKDCEGLAEKHYLMVRLAALMNIAIDKLYDNFQNETKKYFFNPDKKQILYKIAIDDINHTSAEKNAENLAEIVIEEIPDEGTARQFVLEELDEVRQGSEEAQKFVRTSGFKSSEYKGAKNDSAWEKNETIVKLQIIMKLVLCHINDEEMRCRVNLLAVDIVMQHWKLGKYQNNSARAKSLKVRQNKK